jgi:hypothetical protein
MEKHENPKNRPRFPPTEKNVENTVKTLAISEQRKNIYIWKQGSFFTVDHYV